FMVLGKLSALQDMGAQIFYKSNPAAMFYRVNVGYNRKGPEAWSEWTQMGGPLPNPNSLNTGGRDMRLQMFKDEYPLVSTQGKGAVVFRYDHGLTNFKNELLPLHTQYGIP